MLTVWLTALVFLLASLVIGRALLCTLGWRRPTWLAGAVGFAALTVVAPALVRLPGHGATAAAVIGIALVASLVYLLVAARAGPATPPGATSALAAALIVLAAASLPFLFNERVGVLGEGIYTNDHGAQLYWTDWLQNAVGPEPTAVQFGYPTGPQSVVAAVAEASGTSLVDAFNGLLLAIPVLTALAAMAALEAVPAARRVAVAAISALPYLAASFLAQSAFKETAMALFLLAFALVLGAIAVSGGAAQAGFALWSPLRGASPDAPPRRAILVALLVIAAASVFTLSVPGLAWFIVLVPAWALLEGTMGRWRADRAAIRATVARNRVAIGAAAAIALAVAGVAIAQQSDFLDRIGDVQASAGRLESPVFPGEALGIWPEDDFRVVRGEVAGAIPATALALLALAVAALLALRRRETALLAALAAAAAVYAGARLFAGIHVEAKALAVLSPLAALVAARGLLTPADPLPRARYALGVAFVAAAAASSFLALREAPVGFDERGRELESLARQVEGRSVAFLGVDRFGAYWLRGTLVESPGGYLPPKARARPEKVWEQGRAMDLDTLDPKRLDEYDYAITTSAAYQSEAPPNMREVARTDSFVLWRREGPTPRSRVLDAEGGGPGAPFDCGSADGRHLSSRPGTALVRVIPLVGPAADWDRRSTLRAPAEASQELELTPGRWRLSLQYHSQVPLTVEGRGGELAKLPPSLQGMYQTSPGRGSFWPAGELRIRASEAVAISVRAAEPSGLQEALAVERRVWLGAIAATPAGTAKADEVPMSEACGRYVDRFTLERKG